MWLLVRTAFQHGRRFALLGVTVIFLLVVTLASQVEMLSLGVLTKAGADFFELFAPETSGQALPVEAISREQVEARWRQIDTQGTGAISKGDAVHYLSQRKDRNPVNQFFHWLTARMSWRDNLVVLILFLLVVALIKAISTFWSQYLKELVQVKVSRDLRHRFFEHIQTLPLSFYQQYHVGSLSTRVYNDALQIAQGTAAGLTAFLQTPFTLLSTLALCLYLSPQLSLVVFVTFPLIMLPFLYLARRVKKTSRQVLRNTDRLHSVLVECISGIQTIKLFAVEAFSIGRFQHYNTEMARLESKSARYGYLARPVLHVASMVLLGGIILYGMFVAQLAVSDILVFCGLTYLMYEPVKKLSDQILLVQKGIAACERMVEVMELKPQITDEDGAIELTFEREITFEDVWFKYQNEWVLRGVTFSVKKGEVVALVGATGAGKSTIVHLLPRLYEPQEGRICIDGKPLQEYTQRSLRQQIGFVPQRPFFFYDTVAGNIAFGTKYPRAEVEEAARRAHADEFIQRLDHGYDTFLAEGGKDLSGGQQQRLAIARALVRQNPILVLDEATSSLDAVSENKIKAAIDELRGSVTQLIIAHRLSTVEDADKILFLEHGEVVAQGTRDELLETCPGFRAMWDLMMVKESAPAGR